MRVDVATMGKRGLVWKNAKDRVINRNTNI